ncbi:ParB/RepB/Spo0J family partition protein [Sphingomonas sp. FARSPH]|uniref:ParB/RepB/Spo0J family partition protein n=1 Tax=Sphingomonas sp. FARSPH TaxID=2219696 RepID=UPI000E105F39|nr:ParB/RepB/Spo0J family partition protein [Sphingomonas sp. FARSPH]AXJ97514.1 chromosome partitioning protein ParB [Sphingomonas sp. FARSPH]
MEFGNFDVFAAKDEVAGQARVLSLDPSQVYPDPDNVRRAIDQSEIEALAATIKERGQLQPITVAPADADGRHMVHFGERRWRACQHLGIPVRAIVSEQTDAAQVRIDQFIENDQREQLSARDMIAFVASQAKAGQSVSELARVTGRDRATLNRYRSLASAPDFITARLDDISVRGAAALLSAAQRDEAATRAFLNGAPAGSLTERACEQFAREVGNRRQEQADTGTRAQSEQHPAKVAGEGEGSKTHSLPSANDSVEPRAPVARRGGQGDAARFIDVEGKRARIIEAVLHFEGEDAPRTVRFDQ